MDTNNNNFDPTSIGAKPVQDSFDPTSIGARPFGPQTDVNNTAGLLGATIKAQENLDAENAQQNSDNLNSPGGTAMETIKGLPKAGAQVLLDPAAKFAASAVRAPIDIVRGLFGMNPLDDKFKLPSGGTAQSIQSEFGNKYNQVSQGNMSPAEATAGTVGETVGGGADLLGGVEATKGLYKAAQPVGDFLAKKTAQSFEEGALKKSLKVVTPQLTKKETEAALASGRGTGGGFFSKTKILPDQRTIDTAKAVSGIVNPSKSGAENIESVKNALTNEAELLSQKLSKVNQPVSDKGIKTWLDNVKKPIEIEADATQSRKFDITKNALMKIVEGKDKTVSGMLKARKEFDGLVQKEFPTIYDRTNAPWRTAVTEMRGALNDAIEANLPKGTGFKESLNKQKLYYNAIDNMASNSTGEVGKTGIQRIIGSFVKKHPVASTAIGSGVSIGAYEGGKEGGKEAVKKVIGI